jgi:hypothetical protein
MPCEFATAWLETHEDGVRKVVRCDYKRTEAADALASANIPKRYQHCTIANFSVTNR